MDPSLEIRKLPPSYVRELVNVLECHDLWKRLMAIIPKQLDNKNFTCIITLENPHKYHSEHFRLIENASLKYKRTCTEILLDEWGTSGRIRPTLGHLLYLLTKAKLFRAADYVADKLLKQPKPQRPNTGPEALITLDLPEILKQNDKNSEEIGRLLDQIDYPSSALEMIKSQSEQIERHHDNVPAVIPQIVISPDVDEENKNRPNFFIPLVRQKEKTNDVEIVSDMMKFSAEVETSRDTVNISGVNIPNISQLLNNSESNEVIVSDMMNFTSSKDAVCEKHDGGFSEDSISHVSQLFNNSRGNNMEIIKEGHVITIENCNNDNIPQFSQLLQSETENLPNFDLMNNSFSLSLSNSTDKSSTTSNSSCNPALSHLLNSEHIDDALEYDIPDGELNIPNLSAINQTINIDDVSEGLPNLSILNADQGTISPIVPQGESIVNFLPNLSALNIQEEPSVDNSVKILGPNVSVLHPGDSPSPTKSLSVDISTHLLPSSISSQNSSDNSTKSRPCTSPLPNLSLNTLLPHFSYHELEFATNNFNDTYYENQKESGRLLGSGAFGSVFIAFGFGDKPIAVKRLKLENVEVVNINDTITKQFRNEVEVLSKYKHENLLSLLGYSCDGCTYCLLYEYVPGGALKDRLQATGNMLQWKERLSIVMGTARAVSYLHTAFSTPLIHRDIKSANILLDSKNKPKLGDFGLIKLSPSQNTSTATSVFGTSAYMAPEAFRGDVSVKLDSFSFGVVLLELLTSLPPVDDTREGKDLITHVYDSCDNDNISPLLDKQTGSWQEGSINFADKLFKIALKCLEEKKKRPNMVEVTSLLEELLINLSV